ncbi:MAG: AsnC family transcriptional regulator [Acidithiobacillales bacterium SG8_45]|jgi:DNA-binding Lrp family transcriptional regulator|nr:MAG: AsnC family transcriptional regulator [Acidithiobacillales bacterium SG8_45]
MHLQKNRPTAAIKPSIGRVELNALQQQIVNDFQHGFPLTPQPYAAIADSLGVDESTVIETLRQLQKKGVVTRVGAVFRPNTVGVSTLATIAVPAARLESVAMLVNTYSEVNHNYEREHHFNLWFVVTAENQDHLQSVLSSIEKQVGLEILSLPMVEDYHIDLGFPINWEPGTNNTSPEKTND